MFQLTMRFCIGERKSIQEALARSSASMNLPSSSTVKLPLRSATLRTSMAGDNLAEESTDLDIREVFNYFETIDPKADGGKSVKLCPWLNDFKY